MENKVFFEYKVIAEKLLGIFITNNRINNLRDNLILFKPFKNLYNIALVINDLGFKGFISISRNDRYLSRYLLNVFKNKYFIDDIERCIQQLKIFCYLNENEKKGKDSNSIKYFIDNIDELLSIKNNIKFPSGINEIDCILNGGFSSNELVIVAGRPGIGKTAFFVSIIAANVYSNKKTILFVSLEMSSFQIYMRLLSNLLDVNINSINKYIDVAKKCLFNIKVDIRVINFLYIEDIVENIREIFNNGSLSIVFIDYLQLIKSRLVTMNRNYEIGYITQLLKLLSIELNIPIVVASQLSRGIDLRSDKRPILSDLRDSGSIEQDADIVFALSYINNNLNNVNQGFNISSDTILNKENKISVILLKNRNGITKEIVVDYIMDKNKFL